jgi:hypothetical protein
MRNSYFDIGRVMAVASAALVTSCSGTELEQPELAELGSAAQAMEVFRDGFAPQQPGWSVQSSSADYLGQLNGNLNASSVELKLNVADDTRGTLAFNLLSFRSLDPPGSCCTDTLTLFVNHQECFAGSFGDRGNDAFSSNVCAATMMPATAIVEGFQRQISVPISLLAGENSFIFAYSPLQSFEDEAWGIDDVVVDVEPSLEAEYSLTETDTGRPTAALEFLSTDQHNYFSGKTLLFGGVRIEGEPGDEVQKVLLSVTGTAAPVQAEALGLARQRIPDSGVLELPRQRLFELSATELKAQVLDAGDDFEFEIETTMVSGASHVQRLDLRHLINLENHSGMPRRYPAGDRNADDGGDSWVRPHVPALIGRIADSAQQNGFSTLALGDTSSMNGGPFTPHLGTGHAGGLGADFDLLGQDYDRFMGQPFPWLCRFRFNQTATCRALRQFQRRFAALIADTLSIPDVASVFIGQFEQDVFDQELERRLGSALIAVKRTRDAGHDNHFHVSFVDR